MVQVKVLRFQLRYIYNLEIDLQLEAMYYFLFPSAS